MPLTPNIFVVRAFFSFEILSKVLNSSIISWILSLFFLFASKLVFLLALTYANIGNGSGTTLASFPYFFLNILSMFSTFNSVLLELFKSYCFFFRVDLETIALPMNFSFKVFVASKGGFHFLLITFYEKIFFMSFLSIFCSISFSLEPWISLLYFEEV